MFENKNVVQEGPGTVVGSNVKLSGILKDVNDITIHGQVEGEVVSDKHVTIAETAKIKGPVTAKTISISGEVNGEIQASEKLEILETGKIKGSVSTNDLIIKSGAVFNGKCLMQKGINNTEESKASSKSSATKAKKPEPAKKKSSKYELE